MYSPCVTDANDMVNVAKRKLEELVGQDTGSIRKAKEGVVRKDCPNAHSPGMQGGFPAKTAERSVAMHNVDLFTNDDIAKYGEEREDGWERGRAVDDEEGHVIHLEAIR